MTGHLALPDPWWDLRGGGIAEEHKRSAVKQELLAEVAAGHPLARVSGEVIAGSRASDDVLLLLEDGRWAVVHLTWRQAPEVPPWPHVEFYESAQELERALSSE